MRAIVAATIASTKPPAKPTAQTVMPRDSTMDESRKRSSRWRSPLGVFMLVAGAVGVYYLLTEHLTHVAQAVPYLFLLACPLMHLFHRHGGHRDNSHGADRVPEE